MSTAGSPNAVASDPQDGDRRYWIGFCAARSAGATPEDAERVGNKMRRWLKLSPAEGQIEGTVLSYAGMRTAAFWIHFADPPTLIVLAVCVATIIVAALPPPHWPELTDLIIVFMVLCAVQFANLRRWKAGAPTILSLMPPPGTRVTVGTEMFSVGNLTGSLADVRFSHVELRSARNLFAPAWEQDYFVDHVAVVLGDQTVHLDSAAFREGQLLLDTLCTRVPVSAFYETGGPSEKKPLQTIPASGPHGDRSRDFELGA